MDRQQKEERRVLTKSKKCQGRGDEELHDFGTVSCGAVGWCGEAGLVACVRVLCHTG